VRLDLPAADLKRAGQDLSWIERCNVLGSGTEKQLEGDKTILRELAGKEEKKA